MKRISGQALAWLVATAASILLATSAVSSVRDEVTTRPSPLRVPAVTIAAATSTSAPAIPTTTVIETSSTVPPGTTATSAGPGSGTTTAASTTTAPPQTTSTTTPSTTTTTTAAPDDEYYESFQLIGGWVRLQVSGDRVFLAGTVPSPGFALEIEKDGPRTVKVEFSSSNHESKLQAEISDGELEVETSEEDE